MREKRHNGTHHGFSLVEVIVVSALVTLIFGGLFTGVRFMVELIGHSKAESGARSLAVAKIEYIRSLPYDAVGTVGGIPEGTLAQSSTTTLNDIAYTERVLVTYLDRPEDGFGAGDENGVTEDSKIVKVEYTWDLRGKEYALSMVTDIIPVGIESTTGGGTLFINVFDATVAPVAGASVRVVNDTGTSTIDVTVTTNANGIANFPGAPPLSGYQITATKDGYSTDQTYSATAENSSPNPPHVSVLMGVVSTVNFAIDRLGNLLITAMSPAVTETFTDTFSDATGIFSSTGTTITDGALILSGGPGAYTTSGTAYSVPVVPEVLESWGSANFTGATSTNASYLVRVYAVSGSGTTTSFTILPDAVLPGNASGFTVGPLSLATVDPNTYPQLALAAELVSTDSSETPAITEWSLTHVEAQSPIEDVTFALSGAKSIGLHEGAEVPKFSTTIATDGDGEALLSSLEWDVYTIAIDGATEGYDIAEVDGVVPYALDPGASDELTFILVPHTEHSFHISVVDTSGAFIPNANVTLSRTGWSETAETSMYGQAFWGGLTEDTYTVTVEAAGYDVFTDETVSIAGQVDFTATLSASGS